MSVLVSTVYTSLKLSYTKKRLAFNCRTTRKTNSGQFELKIFLM